MTPNAGNGLDLEKYSWSQTLAELTILIPVPPGTRGKDCDVEIGSKTLRAGVKGQEAVLNGALDNDIVVDDCYWNCDGKALEITLQKKDGMKWWSKTVEGEPEVNTKKVCRPCSCCISQRSLVYPRCFLEFMRHCNALSCCTYHVCCVYLCLARGMASALWCVPNGGCCRWSQRTANCRTWTVRHGKRWRR